MSTLKNREITSELIRSELLAFKKLISRTPQTELEYYSDEEFTEFYLKLTNKSSEMETELKILLESVIRQKQRFIDRKDLVNYYEGQIDILNMLLKVDEIKYK